MIKATGNPEIDQATAEIAVALRRSDATRSHRSEQHYYDEAMRLRDAIMTGARATTEKPDSAVTGEAAEQERRVLLAQAVQKHLSDVAAEGRRFAMELSHIESVYQLRTGGA